MQVLIGLTNLPRSLLHRIAWDITHQFWGILFLSFFLCVVKGSCIEIIWHTHSQPCAQPRSPLPRVVTLNHYDTISTERSERRHSPEKICRIARDFCWPRHYPHLVRDQLGGNHLWPPKMTFLDAVLEPHDSWEIVDTCQSFFFSWLI